MGLALVVAGALLAGCSDDDADPGATDTDGQSAPNGDDGTAGDTGTDGSTDGDGDTGTDGPATDGPVVEVVGVTSEFQGVPATVEPGTSFALRNAEDEDLHQLAAILLPDDEERPLDEIMALPELELQVLFQDLEPAFFLVADPGETSAEAIGDGALTEPGRYALVCFLPVGTTAGGAAPTGDVGPPHALEGMYAEVRVTDGS